MSDPNAKDEPPHVHARLPHEAPVHSNVNVNLVNLSKMEPQQQHGPYDSHLPAMPRLLRHPYPYYPAYINMPPGTEPAVHHRLPPSLGPSSLPLPPSLAWMPPPGRPLPRHSYGLQPYHHPLSEQGHRNTLPLKRPKTHHSSESPSTDWKKRVSDEAVEKVEPNPKNNKNTKKSTTNTNTATTNVAPKTVERRQRKNAQSRLRATQLKEQISDIQSKPPLERTEEEISILDMYEERRTKKNERSRERASFRKQQMDDILSKPETSWTEEEKSFMVKTMVAKYKKNEGDRIRRKQKGQVEKHNVERSDDRVPMIPLTPNVPLTPIFQEHFPHDESIPDYAKFFDITPLFDGSSREFVCDSRRSGSHSRGMLEEGVVLNPPLSSYHVVEIPTPKTPTSQRNNLPFLHLTSPLGLSPLHLPRRQRIKGDIYDTLTEFAIDDHAHENQDMIAVSFSTDSQCEKQF